MKTILQILLLAMLCNGVVLADEKDGKSKPGTPEEKQVRQEELEQEKDDAVIDMGDFNQGETITCPYGCGGACNHFLPAPRNRQLYPVGEDPGNWYMLPDENADKTRRHCNPVRISLEVIDQLFYGAVSFLGYFAMANQVLLDGAIACLNGLVSFCQQIDLRPSLDQNQMVEITGGESVLEAFVSQAIKTKAGVANTSLLLNWSLDPLSAAVFSLPVWLRARQLRGYGDSVFSKLQNWVKAHNYRQSTYSSVEFSLAEALPQLSSHAWLVINHNGSVVFSVANTGLDLYSFMVHSSPVVYLIRDKRVLDNLIYIFNERVYPQTQFGDVWYFYDLGEVDYYKPPTQSEEDEE
ncbi:hypothetical protein [Endozoicomonas arenosclerae]|uniref:hypothetical protein n=1 Tax=Endozoicomonas arenosclerae TaxID=1633495 RepID=UPI0007805574|nr:hypothetical protein [Endozoicomonas arenosclerae]